MNKLKEFWNSCDENFAHLTLGRHLTGFDNLTRYWENEFIHRLDFKNTNIVEYGIGGGHLGKYLFKKHGISKYIGIDISERSLEFANNNLLDNVGKYNLYDSDYFYKSFKESADIFVSLACIQHFPNVEYLQVFLNKINGLYFKDIILQIRSGNNSFADVKSDKLKEEDVVFACHINDQYILDKLTNYKLVYYSDIDPFSKYQYLHFKIKEITYNE